MRHAVLTPFFGRLRDRFCEYHEPRSIAEKLRLAREIPGVEGVEVIFPDEVRAAADVGEELARFGLAVAAINVNLKGDRVFHHGALSSPDPRVRDRAVDLLCQAKQIAVELGCPRITCAPLADGYDYPFQIDYRRAWSRMAESVERAASCVPEVTLHLEHKPAEPRTRGLLDVPAKVIRLCRDIGTPSIGITFNTGHAAAGGGLPAAAFADVLAAGIPYYIHFCGATAAWDWDLRAGAQQPWQWAEFLFYLKQDGYTGWLAADTFPVRDDARTLFASNIANTQALCRWLDGLDARAASEALAWHDMAALLGELERWIPQSA